MEGNENSDILNSAESIFSSMVRDALLALELLPDNASAGNYHYCYYYYYRYYTLYLNFIIVVILYI